MQRGASIEVLYLVHNLHTYTQRSHKHKYSAGEHQETPHPLAGEEENLPFPPVQKNKTKTGQVKMYMLFVQLALT